jgi:hypothetical protein
MKLEEKWYTAILAFERCEKSAKIYLHYLHIYGSTEVCWTLAAFLVSSHFTVGRPPSTEDQPVARPLPAHNTAQTE